jgi:hypothetical protein
MRCGNGTERGQHPLELWGEDWMSLGGDAAAQSPRPERDCEVVRND